MTTVVGYDHHTMGTRADFYVGRGEKAEWLGSVAWDGDPENFPEVMKATTEEMFRAAVHAAFKGRDDVTLPKMGWPWPWKDSMTSDYAVAFDGGEAFYSSYGPEDSWHLPKVWLRGTEPKDEDGYLLGEYKDFTPCVFPNMQDYQNVTLGPRSGVMLLTTKRG